MTKNKLLNIGIITCKLLRLFQIVVFVILTSIFVHFQISPSTYKDVDINTKINNSISISFNKSSNYKIHIDGKAPEDSDVLT